MIVGQLEASRRGNAAKRVHVEHRQRRVLALHTAGLTRPQIAEQLKVSLRTVYADLEALYADREAVDEMIEDACITAEDAHLKLSKAFDSRIQELFDENWNLLPKNEWPEPFKSWGLLTEIKVEDVMVQDADGDGTTWKKSGGKRVTVKGPDVLKTIELAMKHKAVAAMAPINQQIDLNVNVSAEQARELSAAKQRMSRVITGQVVDVTPEKSGELSEGEKAPSA